MKSDLEKARQIAGYTKDSSVICAIATVLKAERESLPQSVIEALGAGQACAEMLFIALKLDTADKASKLLTKANLDLEKWQASGDAATSKCPPHEWSNDGERCVKCGDKDWMT